MFTACLTFEWRFASMTDGRDELKLRHLYNHLSKMDYGNGRYHLIC
jgi:hypothetical protein